MHEGKIKYSNLLENKNVFKELEAEKVKNYVYYDQYGGYGMKIIYIPPPFIILHSDFNFDDIVANVNIGERLNLNMTLNEGFSIENSGFMDLLGIILIFSIIASLICGYEITNKNEYFKVLSRQYFCGIIFFKSVISNIIVINFAFLLLIGICAIWLFINGINLFDMPLVYVALSVILVTSLFLSIGTIIGGINKEKSTKVTILIVMIILFVLFIPWLTYKINQTAKDEIESIKSVELKNLKILMAAERRAFKKIGIYKNEGKKAPEDVIKIVEEDQKNDFKKIEENEERRINDVLNRIKGKQSLLSFFPITFVISMNMEISGFGGRSYIEFYLFSKKIKQYFKNFIIRKKIYENAEPGKVEPFITKDDNKNVFYAKSHLPYNFWLGVFLTPFYTVLLLFLSFILLKKRQKVPEPQKAYRIEKEKDNPLFVLCENEEIKTDIFNYFQNQKASVCLEKINTGDFMFNGVTPQELIKHLCMVSRVDEKKALENLGYMGIKDLNIFKLDEETILKIYAAVITAVDFELMVLNDFVKKESRKFEFELFKLLSKLVKDGKKIIYLSCEMKQGANSVENNIRVNEFETFHLGLDKDTLR